MIHLRQVTGGGLTGDSEVQVAISVVIRPLHLADIHANSIALQAVLVDIQAQGGVDEYWCLGDYVALGHDPVGTLELLAALPTAHFVRGNTDRYVISEAKPGPSATDIREDICSGCGVCADICPFGTLNRKEAIQ